jgi:arylformamidase
MARIDYEAEYNNRRRVPESVEILLRWTANSVRFRAAAAAELDVPYGPDSRHRYDLFHAADGGADGPLIVYIHGGYWQRGDRSDYSFVAETFTAAGATVALPSYTLSPQAQVADIVDEMRGFLAALWQKTGRRPVVAGHSAGGHLAAAMMTTDWPAYGDVPTDLVRAGYAVSGVFELEPLIPTSLNDALGLDAATARAASPILWPAPAKGRTFVAAVGGAESQEFLRQSLELTRVWSEAGVIAECVVAPALNHFTVVDEFARPGSAMFTRVLQLARS